MGLFYNDRKIWAAKWLLDQLGTQINKYKCEIAEYNGYRANVVTIKDISSIQKHYDDEILGEASELLEENKHVIFQVKDNRDLAKSKLYISEDGRRAIKSSFYLKLFIEVWVKRLALISVIVVAIFTVIGVCNKSQS